MDTRWIACFVALGCGSATSPTTEKYPALRPSIAEPRRPPALQNRACYPHKFIPGDELKTYRVFGDEDVAPDPDNWEMYSNDPVGMAFLRRLWNEHDRQVTLEFCVDEHGQVASVRVLYEAGQDPAYRSKAVRALRAWTFRPYLDDAGKPIAVSSRASFHHGRPPGTIQPAD